jgi:large subunit ribosomal protein L21
MYSVVEISGHQYKVVVGDIIDVEKIDGEEGTMIPFEKVLFLGGETHVVGAPTVAGAKVTAKLIKTDRDRKVIVFKRAPGKWKKKNGHRQSYSCLLVTEIHDGKGNVAKIDKNCKSAQKFLQ